MKNFFETDQLSLILSFLYEAIDAYASQIDVKELVERIKKNKLIESSVNKQEYTQNTNLNEENNEKNIVTSAVKESKQQMQNLIKKIEKNTNLKEQDIENIYITINKICQVFLLRSANLERTDINIGEALKNLQAKINNLAENLNLTQKMFPKLNTKSSIKEDIQNNIDNKTFAFVYGGFEFRVRERIKFLLKLIQEGYKPDAIVFLGGARDLIRDKDPCVLKLEEMEKHLGKSIKLNGLEKEPFNEYDMMQYLCNIDMCDEFKKVNLHHNYKCTIANFDANKVFHHAFAKDIQQRTRETYIVEYATELGIPIYIVNSPKINLGNEKVTRPTTQTTIEDFFAHLESQKLLNKNDIFNIWSISKQPHNIYQAHVLDGVLSSLPIKNCIEVCGAGINEDMIYKKCDVNPGDFGDTLGRIIYQQLSNYSLKCKLEVENQQKFTQQKLKMNM